VRQLLHFDERGIDNQSQCSKSLNKKGFKRFLLLSAQNFSVAKTKPTMAN
jgi:hypothetical protein